VSGFAPVRAVRAVTRAVRSAPRNLADGSRSGRSYAVTLLTPVDAGAAGRLGACLHALGTDGASPLAALPYVHFARWVVIDRLRTDWPGTSVRPPRLASEYLLFGASLTAPAEDHTPVGQRYVERLPYSFLHELCERIPETADAVWGHCVDYRGTADPDAFVQYLAASQIETALFHVGCPDVTVDEIRRALAIRDALIAFARDHQGEQDPAALRQAYLKEFATWFPLH
jgi:hypothetical protein